MHVGFFPFVNFVDAVFKMSKALNIDFVVNTIGQFSLIGRFSINRFETDVFNIFAEEL